MLRDASSLTCWHIRFPYSFLLRPTKWSSFDKRLNWGHTTWSPHILPINWCYDWLVACSVCKDMVIGVNILLDILSVEKYASWKICKWLHEHMVCQLCSTSYNYSVLWPSQQWNSANYFSLQTVSALPSKLTTYWLPAFPCATSSSPWHKYVTLALHPFLCSLGT